ncbi:MAG: hypothetical protein JRN06_01955 [Nitrososphaerota archaeon]|nr:hypothetical protein [Nitrososphaerota archaeon]MDG7023381.1 hypothetical protein [Nitrososphaerota archaeon]
MPFNANFVTSAALNCGPTIDPTSTTLTVNGVPSGVSSVQLASPSGAVLGTATVTNGVATFDLGPYTYPVNASIVLKDSSGGTVASSGTFNLYGGDIYTVS